MAKHIHRRLNHEEAARVRRDRNALDQERDEIIAHGRRVLDRHVRLSEALAAIKSARQAQGVSLAELSRRTGVSKSSLSRLENDPNANPTVTTLMRLAEALGQQITIQLTPSKDAA